MKCHGVTHTVVSVVVVAPGMSNVTVAATLPIATLPLAFLPSFLPSFLSFLIAGKHNLTLDEVKGQARFSDSIGIFPEFIDGYNILILPTTGRYFQVPYGCLVPCNVDNLLVGGRCVAGDNGSHAATRNMMCCTVTGQGAGVAAAVSIKNGTSTAQVPIEAVQEELKRQNVRYL